MNRYWKKVEGGWEYFKPMVDFKIYGLKKERKRGKVNREFKYKCKT